MTATESETRNLIQKAFSTGPSIDLITPVTCNDVEIRRFKINGITGLAAVDIGRSIGIRNITGIVKNYDSKSKIVVPSTHWLKSVDRDKLSKSGGRLGGRSKLVLLSYLGLNTLRESCKKNSEIQDIIDQCESEFLKDAGFSFEHPYTIHKDSQIDKNNLDPPAAEVTSVGDFTIKSSDFKFDLNDMYVDYPEDQVQEGILTDLPDVNLAYVDLSQQDTDETNKQKIEVNLVEADPEPPPKRQRTTDADADILKTGLPKGRQKIILYWLKGLWYTGSELKEIFPKLKLRPRLITLWKRTAIPLDNLYFFKYELEDELIDAILGDNPPPVDVFIERMFELRREKERINV